MKSRTKGPFNFVMNPPMADTMAFESKKNEATEATEKIPEAYIDLSVTYKKEKEKNEQL